MDFRQFMEGQESVYRKFRDYDILKDGILPSPDLSASFASYIVAFRFPPRVANKVEEVSEKISRVVPAIRYNRENVHAAITTGRTRYESADQGRLKEMSRKLHAIRHQLKFPYIDYNGWLYKGDTVIVEGWPTRDFLETPESVLNALEDEDFRYPLDARITASMFRDKILDENITDFLNLMKTAPRIGLARPMAIDVGYFTSTPEKFDFVTYERFKLP